MNRHRLQVEELEPRNPLSGMGATVEPIEPFAIQFPITVHFCHEGNPVVATVSIDATVSGKVVTDAHGGTHQRTRIDIPKTTTEDLGQEFLIQGHRNFLMNVSPSGSSNFTNVSQLKVIPLDQATSCSDQDAVTNSLQHQTINANGVITASIGDEPPA